YILFFLTITTTTEIYTLSLHDALPISGLKILEDSVPALHYIVQNDSLIFRGTGDPSLLNPDLPQSRILNFLASRGEKIFYLPPPDRKSTRLNSSHVKSSYAVFCLKKKK